MPMSVDDGGSVTCWLGNLKEGDLAAAQPLWERYFSRLVAVARGKLKKVRRTSAGEDEEDAALSAFHSFCEGAAHGRYPAVHDREELWKILLVITRRKAWDQVERERREKRGRGRVVGESDLPGSGSGAGGLDQLAGPGPRPEEVLLFAEGLQDLLASLGDELLRKIAIMRLANYQVNEIAGELGCARETVSRKLELIRKQLRTEAS